MQNIFDRSSVSSTLNEELRSPLEALMHSKSEWLMATHAWFHSLSLLSQILIAIALILILFVGGFCGERKFGNDRKVLGVMWWCASVLATALLVSFTGK